MVKLSNASTVEQVLSIMRQLMSMTELTAYDVQKELRERKLPIWLYAIPPTSPQQFITDPYYGKEAQYLLQVFVGSQEEFINTHLPAVGVSYNKSLDNLTSCGFEHSRPKMQDCDTNE